MWWAWWIDALGSIMYASKEFSQAAVDKLSLSFSYSDYAPRVVAGIDPPLDVDALGAAFDDNVDIDDAMMIMMVMRDANKG